MNASATASTPRRRPRDWVVDSLLFLLAALVGLLAAADQLEGGARPEPAWLFPADQVAAALGCAGLWWRRRWPVGLALVLVGLSTFSELVAGAMVVALFTVAVYRPPRTSLAVYGLSVLAAFVYVLVRPEPGVPRQPRLVRPRADGLQLQPRLPGPQVAAVHPQPRLPGPLTGRVADPGNEGAGLSTAPRPRSRLEGIPGPGRGWPGWPSGSPWPTGGWSTARPPRAAGGWRPGYPGRHDRIRAPDRPGDHV